MASIFSSRRALEAAAALEQRPAGLRLAELAGILSSPVSSTQVALGILADEGLASSAPTRPPQYAIAADRHADVEKLLDVASRGVLGEQLLASALRANRAVEFAGRDAEGLLLVVRWDAEPPDEGRLARMLDRMVVQVARFPHDELRDRLRDEPALRDRALHSQAIVGTVDRSFPEPFRHGSSDALLLGRLHPAVRQPSQGALMRLARRFGLAELRVFGSAVHSDFRPDSDIDILVRRRPGVRRTLEDELSLRRALEDLLGRDVDVVDRSVMREQVLRRAESEGVVLYG